MRWKSVLDRLPRWSRMTSRQRWVLAGSGAFVLLLLAIFWFAGRPLVALVSDADGFGSGWRTRAFGDSWPLWG